MAAVEDKPFCVTVVGVRFFYKDRTDISEDEVYRYAVVSIGRQTQEVEPRPAGADGVEWGDVLQFNPAKIRPEAEIVIEVYIKWRLNSELIGEVRVPYERYKDVTLKYALLHWYPMKLDRPIDPAMKGEIGLIIGQFEGKAAALKGKKFLSVDDPAYDAMNAAEIWGEAVKTAKENNKILDRIVGVTQQTKNLAIQDAETLNAQMNTVKAVEADLENINDDVVMADEKVHKIESCWFMFCGGGGKKKVKKQQNIRNKAKARAEEDRRRAEEQKAAAAAKAEKRAKPPPQQAKALSELLATSNSTDDAATRTAKDELHNEVRRTEKNLEEVHAGVKDLKAIALDLKDNLTTDLDNLNNVNQLATKDLAQVNRVHDRTRRLC